MPDETTPAQNAEAARQETIWQTRAASLRQASADSADYAAAYDEVNQFLREHGDPALDRGPDGSIYGCSGDPERDEEKRLMERFAAEPGHRLLEFGTGDGRLAIAIARRRVDVTALDISSVAVEAASALAAREPGLTVRFQQGSALGTPFADASFDRVMSADMVEHLRPDHVPVHLAEVLRLLRPGGAYVLTLPTWVPEDEVDPLHLGNYRPQEMRQLLEAAGFTVTLFPLWIYQTTRRLEAVFPKAKTWRARLSHVLARLPIVGPRLARRVISRWYGGNNFYYAEKAVGPLPR